MINPSMSIIIPFYNRWDLTHARLMNLYDYAPDDAEIILINDASTEADCEKGIQWWKERGSRHEIRYHRSETNEGFGASHNKGAKLAKGEVLVLLSNDVRIFANIFQKIHYLVHGDNKILLGGRIVDWKAGWNEFEINKTKFVIPYAEGWLLSCTKTAWKELGGFDLRYGKFDYEDIDLSMNALVSGYNIVGLNSKKVEHLSGATISSLNIDRMRITQENRKKFEEKWKNYFHRLVTDLEHKDDTTNHSIGANSGIDSKS